MKKPRLIAYLLAASLPLTAGAAGVVQQEFSAAVNATPDLTRGEKLFNATCTACHGADAAGVRDGSVPAIAAQHPRVIIRQLVDYRHDKRWDLRMQNFTNEHHLVNARAIADVAAYIGSLAPATRPGIGSGEYAGHGGMVYASLCTSCHGTRAGGDDSLGVPRLAGQHYEYLLRQMHDAVEGRRPNFPREHIVLLERFQRAEFIGVADYLSRLD